MEDPPPASNASSKSNTHHHLDDNNNRDPSPSSSTASAAHYRKNISHSHQLRPQPHPHHQSRQSRNHSLSDLPYNIHDDEDEEEEFNRHYSTDPDPNILAQALPEFIPSVGGTGIFKVPTRAAVHPSRPPCLELRPHPLRETQAGKFLRNIACTETQLWAGQENGVRFWRFEDSYAPGLRGRVRRGEEDAAPFHESANTSPTMCLLVDSGNRLIWSGHKDGKVRSWKMDQPVDNNDASNFKEGLSWQAHRVAVYSIVMSFYGDMWTGGEGGTIKIWPWESIEKSLSLKPEEKHMAALLVERSFVDLRSQVTVNGTCSISSGDIKYILSDHIRAKIWIAQALSFSLWDAHTKELIKVFNIEGQIENRVEMPSGQDQPSEDEVKVKPDKGESKKDKPQGFLQRSRNAIMGAADVVRRVATRGAGAFVEDNAKKTEALVLAPDGMIWTGCTTGMLIQWDGNGTRLQDITHHPHAVQCFCTFGRRIYIGYVSGYVQVMDLEGHLIAGWVAHNGPVLKMAFGNGCIYSLASHGGVRAWNITSPGPIDNILRSELKERDSVYLRRANLKILIGTWNVGQGRASHDALMTWLGSVASDVGIVVVGLQEVDMGAGFLAMSAAKETVGLEGSAVGNWWLDAIGKILDENLTFERMGSRQLAGLQIGLWVRKNLRNHAGDVDIGAVPCGFGRAIGNKGGVGVRIRVLDRIICFVNCHLAAHLEAVNRRNADFDHIFRNMVFSRSSLSQSIIAASVPTNSQSNKNTNQAAGNNTEETARMELADADMVVFCGDFNYRLFGMSYDEARDFVSQRCFDWLREKDQLRAEMKAGRVFQGMREAIITFPPTYKFERGRPGLAGYDSGEKKRIPAWCDRVIYRDNRSGPVEDCTLECPIVSSILMYEACMDVIESDHKPVRCKFHIKIAHVERSVRRQQFGEIMKSNEKIKAILEELKCVPETVVSTNRIVLQNQDTAVLRITSKSAKDEAVFKIICEGQCVVKEDGEEGNYRPRGCSGFPRWLEVTPAAGIVKPEQSVEVQVHHEEFKTPEDLVDGIPQNWLSEDAREKEVILAVVVGGSSSTETITHRVHVRHCFSAKPIPIGLKSTSNKSNQSSDSVENR